MGFHENCRAKNTRKIVASQASLALTKIAALQAFTKIVALQALIKIVAPQTLTKIVALWCNFDVNAIPR